jgi:hypothetical protein
MTKVGSRIVQTLRTVPDHCGDDARSKVTGGVDSVACAWLTVSVCYRGRWGPIGLLWVRRDVPVFSLHQKNNWLTTCRRANPKKFTTSDTETRGETRTNWVGGEETSSFQRTLIVPALKVVDRSRVIGENQAPIS